MGYRALGSIRHDGKVIDHGSKDSAKDVGGEDNFKALITAKGVVSDEEFKRLHPEQNSEVIPASGTPSNLAENEELEAKGLTADSSSSASDGESQPAKPAATQSSSGPSNSAKGADASKASNDDKSKGEKK